jgi:hypothetical protein
MKEIKLGDRFRLKKIRKDFPEITTSDILILIAIKEAGIRPAYLFAIEQGEIFRCCYSIITKRCVDYLTESRYVFHKNVKSFVGKNYFVSYKEEIVSHFDLVQTDTDIICRKNKEQK